MRWFADLLTSSWSARAFLLTCSDYRIALANLLGLTAIFPRRYILLLLLNTPSSAVSRSSDATAANHAEVTSLTYRRDVKRHIDKA
jgi:hypothetical protein